MSRTNRSGFREQERRRKRFLEHKFRKFGLDKNWLEQL